MRQFYPLVLISWLAYFAIPFINGVGESGARQIQLCTVLGVQTITVYDQTGADTPQIQSNHTGKGCVCVQFALNTLQSVFVPVVSYSSVNYFSDPLSLPQNKARRPYFARAPPTISA
ncbi:hypothetical protein [Marinomonas mediterranea]|uniref:DUF2946 domain-containing protein n=1 Tax=Marinomonas mediterranea (strain ATCC 700492 / JCM 21426 / NBRC 103028 / MMB-1) TaxID=717774 RepID=F2JTW1_MARM1|nr:hypothetical protein [Marinomonas mediterranea]ADZ90382.1 hypothetical protein Marme_1107 [Marinomonas mediterranea MMB-1]WCN08438.1 hypothetical protein GV055_05630 [Marinomonas mediterranea]WCN12492.1 hypothetical protein GV054_05470 [Marinomonas mediterranea]WCN16564.1 hypothetical protein GV053_05600 [Marinomonas mediterranea MMB-1]